MCECVNTPSPCPANSQKKGYVAHFDEGICQDCPLVQICTAQKGRRDTSWHLRFTEVQVHVSQQRQRNQKNEDEAHNLRASVEATVRQVNYTFPGSKLPVRGHFRVSCMMMGSAIMANGRRISRYLDLKTEQKMVQKEGNKGQKCPENSPLYSFLLNTKFNLSLFAIKILAISPFRLVNVSLLR